MGNSLIVAMETEIEKLIKNIAVKDGYNYKWHDVIFDGDLPQRVFPSAKIELASEINMDEPQGDDIAGPTGAFAGAYYNAVSYNIIIGGVKADGTPASRAEQLNALDDLKKIFGINYTLGDSGASVIMYKGFRFVKEREEGPFVMESNWLVRYYQSRTEPGDAAEV